MNKYKTIYKENSADLFSFQPFPYVYITDIMPNYRGVNKALTQMCAFFAMAVDGDAWSSAVQEG
jgi:hypothetical protein